jgi:hypothetical protein
MISLHISNLLDNCLSRNQSQPDSVFTSSVIICDPHDSIAQFLPRIVHSIVLIMNNVSLFCQNLMRSASASASPFFATRFWNGKRWGFFFPLQWPQGLCICHTQPDHELGALKATDQQAQTECIYKPFQASGHVMHIRWAPTQLKRIPM